MLVNPPPDRCDSCKRVARAPGVGTGLAAGDPAAWILLEGPDTLVTLDDGRTSMRRGKGWVCRRCGHTVPTSRELPSRM
jgi:hypothetical protein